MESNIIPFMRPSERKELTKQELAELNEALIMQNAQIEGFFYNPRYHF
jgi:hypothetical protein